jgi:NAD(P)-dependent dehydrogenase (short-subunit alcohol dehydrogenase family)
MRRFVEHQETVMLAYLGRDAAVDAAARQSAAPPPDSDPLPRFTFDVIEVPAPAGATPPLAGALLITDDERGIAAALAASLQRHGAASVVLRAGELGDLEAAASVVAEARERHGSVAGVVHLAALRPRPGFEELEPEAWSARLAADVEPLFLLARAAADDLANPGARIVAVTALGPTLTGEAAVDSVDPGQAALAGFVKTAATEWPQAIARVVDLDLEDPPARCAEHLCSELTAADGEIEVAWSAARRSAPRVRRSPLAGGADTLRLHEGSVILMTGGARGITAQVALELAERHRPLLVLAGRTPLPAEPEPAVTARLASTRDLRLALIEQLGPGARPAEVEAACSRLLRAREVQGSIAAMRAAGATVEYRQVDVGDSAATRRLVDAVYAAHGRIDGVIHGAGIIEDSLIADKDVASLRRVLAVKAVAAVALSRALRPDDLEFLVLFGSVAGRFGNRGQADYAAANQVLSKLAAYLDRRWPARVVTIDWAPWSDTGMAAAEVGERLEALGMRRVAPAAGRRALERELRLGRKGEAEVILGDGPWAAAAAPVRPALEAIAR